MPPNDLPNLHVHLYPAHPAAQPAGWAEIYGRQLEVLSLDTQKNQLGAMNVSMEQLAEIFAVRNDCYFEWDGSFTWTGTAAGNPWQLFGMIYDLGEFIVRVELKGQCSLEVWRELCHYLSTSTPLMAHLIDPRQYVSTTELEKLWNG